MLAVLLVVAALVLGLVVLGVLALSLWRRVSALGREVARAGDRVTALTTELERLRPATQPSPPARP